ncbi:ABC transporter permease [Oscillibacter sp.]|uniref:ABC transporter permease n=1 Tax=Oscillibacter sp. TaxID=1945593 RepID=UPI0028ACF3FF|nr:ABC transporter permease [Oscillibacter sp.]
MKRNYADILLFNVGAVVVGLFISACMLLFMKIDPVEVYKVSFLKIVTDRYTMGEVLVKSTPLIFTALAFAFTYKANLFNIGAQGQFYAGAIAAISLSLALGDTLPGWLLILLVLTATFVAGGAVGSLIGLAKAKCGANEFLVSMMSTYVVSALMDYLLRTVLRETKGEYLQTDPISVNAYLPAILPGTRVHLGFVIAVVSAILIWVLLYKTQLGFRIRAVGCNANAAELAGIQSRKIMVIAFLISGGLAGMAGMTEVNGVQHMLLQNFNVSIGSFGIGIAILANGNPIGVIFAALLFGFMNVMGTTMGRLPGLNIPSSVIDFIEGIVMICVIISYFLRRYTSTARDKKRLKKEGATV